MLPIPVLLVILFYNILVEPSHESVKVSYSKVMRIDKKYLEINL